MIIKFEGGGKNKHVLLTLLMLNILFLWEIINIILMEKLSRNRHLKKKILPPSPCSKWYKARSSGLWWPSFHVPSQFSSGLLATITGTSSKVCPSAPVGRARLSLWCGTRWRHTGCMFSVRVGITSATTGTGRLTGAQEIIQVTWRMWLSLMEVSSWRRCLWACKRSWAQCLQMWWCD